MARMDASSVFTADAPLADRSATGGKPTRVRKPTPRLLALTGVNGASIRARRFRELVLSLADDCGGPDCLSAATANMCRQAAAIMLDLEEMSERVVRGDPVDHEQQVRLSNSLHRLLGKLGLKKRPEQKLSVPEFLARRDAMRANGG